MSSNDRAGQQAVRIFEDPSPSQRQNRLPIIDPAHPAIMASNDRASATSLERDRMNIASPPGLGRNRLPIREPTHTAIVPPIVRNSAASLERERERERERLNMMSAPLGDRHAATHAFRRTQTTGTPNGRMWAPTARMFAFLNNTDVRGEERRPMQLQMPPPPPPTPMGQAFHNHGQAPFFPFGFPVAGQGNNNNNDNAEQPRITEINQQTALPNNHLNSHVPGSGDRANVPAFQPPWTGANMQGNAPSSFQGFVNQDQERTPEWVARALAARERYDQARGFSEEDDEMFCPQFSSEPQRAAVPSGPSGPSGLSASVSNNTTPPPSAGRGPDATSPVTHGALFQQYLDREGASKGPGGRTK